MKVIDLIIKLQDLPPNMDVMIDQTVEGSTMFKFCEINSADELETAAGEKMVVLSPSVWEDEGLF
jgi:hypothetical protein